MNIISRNWSRMDGFILRLFGVAMAYRSQAESKMTCCVRDSISKDNMDQPQHLVYGAMNVLPDFGIEYVGKHHALHLLKILEQHYEITASWEGGKFAVVYLA